jgi:translation initiation factor 1
MSKKKPDRFGVVYSTNPDFRYEEPPQEESSSPPPSRQRLRVMLDRKQRGGKEVTLVTGFSGGTSDLEALGKTLKTKCGSGGAVKDGEILIQGNHREKIVRALLDMGYTDTKAAGG